jgi:hypothetical protein
MIFLAGLHAVAVMGGAWTGLLVATARGAASDG